MTRQRWQSVLWTLLTVCWLGVIDSRLLPAQLQIEAPLPAANAQQPFSPRSPVDPAGLNNQAAAPTATAQNPTQQATQQATQPAAQPATQPPPAAATTSPATASAPTIGLTSELINSRLEQIQRTTEIEVSLKDAVVPLYQRAQVDLKSANDAARLRKELSGRQAAAPKTLAETKQTKENQAPRIDYSIMLDSLSFDETQKALQDQQRQLTAATELRTKLSEQVDTREKRRKELPQLISEARSKMEAVEREQAATSTPASVDPMLKEATTWSQMAQKMAVSEQVQLLEQEQRVYEAETELLPLQLELARADEKHLQDQVRKLTEGLDRLRQEGIAKQRQEVRELLVEIPKEASTPAELHKLGLQLMERINQWLELVKKKAEITTELASSKALLEKWKDRYTKMVNRVEPQPGQDVVAGFNSWVGLMLRKQRNELPDPQKLERQIRHYQQEAQAVDVMMFELEDALQQINAWSDDGRSSFSASTLLSSDKSIVRSDVAGNLQITFDRLLAKDKQLIEMMKVDIDTYLNNLYQVADLKTQTNVLVGDYHSFIEKHVLWIRSSDKLDKSDFREAAAAFHWLVNYENWERLVVLLGQDAQHRPWWTVLFLTGFLTVLVNHSRMRRMLAVCGDRAAKRSATDFGLTMQSLLLTIAISLPVPLVMLYVHWRLLNLDELGNVFNEAIAHGLLIAAAVFTPFEFLRQMCRTGGLAIKHFEWPESAAKLLVTNLRWLIDLATPIATLVGVMEGQGNTRYQSSLGRLAFLVLMILLLAFSARVFFPRNGVFADYLRQYRGGWLDRLRWGWYPLIVFSPIALAALSFVGYHYTSQRLALHLHSSFWSVVALITVYSLLRRWLLLSRRKIMVDQAKQRLAEAARRDPTQAVAASNLASVESELNLSTINEQTMRLVSSFMIVSGLVAISVIWSDVLPAIGMLENFKLWDVQGSKPNEVVTITLANLVVVIPIFILTLIAGRNLPGLMEIALLQHLPLTGAARYAISTLSRYAILILGIVASSSAIGLRWSSIQWLVAALGVGLGFGLQEIFANFVSGIILLFEQPIRVGDVITLDGVTGSVSKIRMRATTLVNWDRQELIIPNKDLITGKLLNWTLSDTTNRVQIRVGVAYGSDTEEACRILRDIVSNHPNIMKDPAPSVSFENFGEGSLDLTIRAFLANLEVRLETVHNLHTQIYTRLRSAGIEIAYPQRDLHIRSFPTQLLQSLVNRNGSTKSIPNQPTGASPG